MIIYLPTFHASHAVFISDTPILMLDQNGTCIGGAAPPPPDQYEVNAMTEELEELVSVGMKPKGSKRGKFPIVEHGIGFGGGSKVQVSLANEFCGVHIAYSVSNS